MTFLIPMNKSPYFGRYIDVAGWQPSISLTTSRCGSLIRPLSKNSKFLHAESHNVRSSARTRMIMRTRSESRRGDWNGPKLIALRS